MPDFRAKSGPGEVLASGIVIAFQGNPITIDFSYGPLGTTLGPNLSLTFSFIDIPGETHFQARIEGKSRGPNALELVLYNHSNPIGIGTSAPLHFWNLPLAQLFINFRVYAMAGADKALQFSIYRVQGVNPAFQGITPNG